MRKFAALARSLGSRSHRIREPDAERDLEGGRRSRREAAPPRRRPEHFRLLACIALSTAAELTTAVAAARPEAPGELQQAAGMKCVPLCTMCHTSNPGVRSNVDPNKPVANALLIPIASQSDITPAWNTYAQANPAAAALVKDGKEPSTGQDVCGPIYGCAVHVENEATWQRDYTAPIVALGAIALAAFVRRRKRS